MAKIYVLMGKSSSGKDTIYNELRKITELNLKNITMYTTRPMRVGEKDGREYFFTDEKYVRNLEENNRIIELRAYNTIHGIWKYFTADDGQIDKNSDSKFLIIATLEAYEKYVEYYGKDMIVPIYIEVDDKTRIHRALAREDAQNEPKYAEMCRRFLADEQDFSYDRLEKAGIDKRYNNINLKECISEIANDIMKS